MERQTGQMAVCARPLFSWLLCIGYGMGSPAGPNSFVLVCLCRFRSAFAKRTPDSAAPMLTFGERWATPSKPGQLPNGGGPTTSTPAWTPMRRSTMALVEQYEQKDATSSKRSRSSPPSSHSGTPMVGSGISSLRSFAIQPSVYRRRVRPRNEPTALPQPASLPPPEQLSSTDDKATPKTKLTTETARRILMTLDSLATKVRPQLYLGLPAWVTVAL